MKTKTVALTYERFKELSNQYDQELNKWSEILNSFPRLADGRTTDETKSTHEFIEAKISYRFHFDAYRKLNQENKPHLKTAAKERQALREKNLLTDTPT